MSMTQEAICELNKIHIRIRSIINHIESEIVTAQSDFNKAKLNDAKCLLETICTDINYTNKYIAQTHEGGYIPEKV